MISMGIALQLYVNFEITDILTISSLLFLNNIFQLSVYRLWTQSVRFNPEYVMLCAILMFQLFIIIKQKYFDFLYIDLVSYDLTQFIYFSTYPFLSSQNFLIMVFVYKDSFISSFPILSPIYFLLLHFLEFKYNAKWKW